MLFKITRSDPWYANIVNFMVACYIPPRENKRRLAYESRLHIWDPPYLFRVCSDGLLRRCVSTEEGIKIIERCHSSPYGGHYGTFRTHAKIWQSGFFWLTMLKTQRISSGDVEHVRGTGISIQEMPCHLPTTSRYSSSMSEELTIWDHS
jgi:hypothetical protein